MCIQMVSPPPTHTHNDHSPIPGPPMAALHGPFGPSLVLRSISSSFTDSNKLHQIYNNDRLMHRLEYIYLYVGIWLYCIHADTVY